MFNRTNSTLTKPNFIERLKRKIILFFYFEQWQIMISKGKNNQPAYWNDFKTLLPPKDHFWADPFPWKYNGNDYIFYEEFPFSTLKGHISCISLDKNANIISNEVVIKKPYHLSYPFIFEYDNRLYMLPESHQSNSIELYLCESFPNSWVLHKIMIDDIVAVDSTLLEYNGKWWLFANVVQENGNSYDSLYLFYANSPLSDKWYPHPSNPVVKDIGSARPAGRIFKRDDVLIRPSQDCSIRYGYAINFNRIVTLSETKYEEVREYVLKPSKGNWRFLSTHTWNEFEDLRLVDAELWRAR